jgi:hypothetical protein
MTTPTPGTIGANLRIRAAEIQLEISQLKRQFFVDGVSTPLGYRLGLEEELAEILLTQLKAKTPIKAKEAKIRELANIVLRECLKDLGLATLMEECRATAEVRYAAEFGSS